MPSSRHAWITRRAISPRLAIRIFLNMAPVPGLARAARRADGKEPLAVLDGLAVLHVDLHELAVALGVDLVHQLHCFDDAEHLPLPHLLAGLDKGLRARLRGRVERADDRRLDDCE